jgi:hypothetical protein
MKPISLSIIAAPAAAMTLVKTVLFAGAVVAFAPAIVLGQNESPAHGRAVFFHRFHPQRSAMMKRSRFKTRALEPLSFVED